MLNRFGNKAAPATAQEVKQAPAQINAENNAEASAAQQEKVQGAAPAPSAIRHAAEASSATQAKQASKVASEAKHHDSKPEEGNAETPVKTMAKSPVITDPELLNLQAKAKELGFNLFPLVKTQDVFAGKLDNPREAVILDTETTGLTPSDEVIQLSMIRFTFDADTGEIGEVLGRFDGYQEPARLITPDITAMTGITHDMVAGKFINPDEVGQFIAGADVITAHGSEFDRGMMELNFPEIEEALMQSSWACSYIEGSWKEMGLNNAKLDYLLFKHGYTFDAHRADKDCEALLTLLSLKRDDGTTYMSDIYKSSLETTYKIRALDSPFASKDVLKERGYIWSDGTKDVKCWWKSFSDKEVGPEVDFLVAKVYNGPFKGSIEKENAHTRYSTLAKENPIYVNVDLVGAPRRPGR